MEAEVRHHEEQKRLARGRYETLCEERYSLDGKAEEAMTRLVEVLDRLEGLYAEKFALLPTPKLLPRSPGPTRHDRAVVGEEASPLAFAGMPREVRRSAFRARSTGDKPKWDEKV